MLALAAQLPVRDGVVIPRIWVTIALSILIHIAALWELPPIAIRMPGPLETETRGPLSLRLVPPGPPAPPAISVPPQPSARPSPPEPRPKAAPRPQPPPPPVIALEQPKPDTPSPTVPPVPAPKPAPPSIAGDMDSYIAARRQARGAPETPPSAAEDADARRKEIIAGNLGSSRDQAFGYDPSRGGGVFQIESLSLDYAEFLFHGWNKDIGRNSKQLIAVRKGDAGDIRVAVVRKMVSIIREYEKEDFVWVSQRLGRRVLLSARARDRTGLEEFMMQEFFYNARPAQR